MGEKFSIGILNKLMDTMRLTEEDDEDYFIDDDYEDETCQKRLFNKKKKKTMTMMRNRSQSPVFFHVPLTKVVPMRRMK